VRLERKAGRPAIRAVSLGRHHLTPEQLAELARAHGMEVIAQDELTDAVAADVEVILSDSVRLDAARMSRHPRARFALAISAGYDYVDLAEAGRRGMVVSHCPDFATIAVAEHTLGLMLALARHIPAAHASVREGRWDPFSFKGCELRGRTLGIIGFGRIGQQVAVLGRAVGMEVLAICRESPAAQRARLLAQSDVVSFHVPLDEETRGMANRQMFGAMRDGVLVVNTSRGAVVDTIALAEALGSGKVAAAALDVLAGEPDVAGNPLLGLERVVLTPHIGGYTREARRRLSEEVFRTVSGFLTGRPCNVLGAGGVR
jgi:D-3-phosphoglycerate dehydrogenase